MSAGVWGRLSTALLALFILGGICVVQADAQVEVRRPAVGTGVAHIRSISPRSGPAGTELHVVADGLPVSTRVYVALAAMDSGYEVNLVALTTEDGELRTIVTVPERHRDHWDHSEVVLVLREESSEVMATSDPFHITNEAGHVQRVGVIEIAKPGCPALKSWDGLTYALVGDHAASLLASAGHEVMVEGPIVDGTCGLQNAIDPVQVSLPPRAR